MSSVAQKHTTHRGVVYAVCRIDPQHWKWEIAPPSCIKELRVENGVVSGTIDDAVRAAKNAIEIQTRQFTQ